MDDRDGGAWLEDGRLQEPRDSATHQDVKHVAGERSAYGPKDASPSDGVTDGHVTMTLLHDSDSGEGIRHADLEHVKLENEESLVVCFTPAAMKVRPMTVSGMPKVNPMIVIIHTWGRMTGSDLQTDHHV